MEDSHRASLFQRLLRQTALVLASVMPGGAIASPPATAPQAGKSEDQVIRNLAEKMYDIYKYSGRNLFDIENFSPELSKGEMTGRVVSETKEKDAICDMLGHVDKNKTHTIEITGNETKQTYVFQDKEGESFAKADTILLKECKPGKPGQFLEDGRVVKFMAVAEPGALSNQMRFIVRDEYSGRNRQEVHGHPTDYVGISFVPPDREYPSGCFKGRFYGGRAGHQDQSLGVQARSLIEELASKVPGDSIAVGRE